MNRRVLLYGTCIAVVIAGQFLVMNEKLLRTRRKFSHQIDQCKRWQAKLASFSDHRPFNPVTLPKALETVALGNGDIILDVKDVHIRNVFAPYNAALIEKAGGGYDLFFRYDLVRQMYCNTYHTHIGHVALNEQFEQTEQAFTNIDTHSVYSEDPRVLKVKDQLYLIYNDARHEHGLKRQMHIALLDQETFQPQFITSMHPNLSPCEKNWVPFTYEDTVHFEYQILSPRKVLRLDHPHLPVLTHLQEPLPQYNLDWEQTWGKPLGGSSARLIDGQYLAFFHSKFKDVSGIVWYVMGAYTFEAKPPFRITLMSQEPLIYKKIYCTQPVNTAEPIKYVIFPSGYAIQSMGDKTMLHLACGENDSAIKIVTIDKDRLLQSLHPLKETN